MATRVLVMWVLILSIGWVSLFAFFTRYYGADEIEKKRVAFLQKKLNKNLRKVAQLEMNFSEYKDSLVAAGLKIKDNTKWTDPKRMIASVMADPEFKNIPQIQPGNKVEQAATRMYKAGDFNRAAEMFGDFIRKYPDHPLLPKAAYLLAESYFNTGQLENSVKTIDFVITQFPETEYAGYALLRLGWIFKHQSRLEEAAQIFEMVINNYSNSNCASMADKDMRELEL